MPSLITRLLSILCAKYLMLSYFLVALLVCVSKAKKNYQHSLTINPVVNTHLLWPMLSISCVWWSLKAVWQKQENIENLIENNQQNLVAKLSQKTKQRWKRARYWLKLKNKRCLLIWGAKSLKFLCFCVNILWLGRIFANLSDTKKQILLDSLP